MPRALEYRDVVKHVKNERGNVEVHAKKGKGSHRVLFDPDMPAHFPLPHHGDNKRRIPPGMLKDLIRIFDLPADIFD